MENDNKITSSSIVIVLITNLIIFIMYIYTININSPTFFLFFVIERIMTIQYQEELFKVIEDVSPDRVGSKRGLLIIILTLAQVIMFIYAFFRCPRLFMLLLVGEVLDFVNLKIKDRFISK